MFVFLSTITFLVESNLEHDLEIMFTGTMELGNSTLILSQFDWIFLVSVTKIPLPFRYFGDQYYLESNSNDWPNCYLLLHYRISSQVDPLPKQKKIFLWPNEPCGLLCHHTFLYRSSIGRSLLSKEGYLKFLHCNRSWGSWNHWKSRKNYPLGEDYENSENF